MNKRKESRLSGSLHTVPTIWEAQEPGITLYLNLTSREKSWKEGNWQNGIKGWERKGPAGKRWRLKSSRTGDTEDLKEIASKGRRGRKPEVGTGGGREYLRRERTVCRSLRSRQEERTAARLPCYAPGGDAASWGPGKTGKGRSASWTPRPGLARVTAQLDSSAQRQWSNTSHAPAPRPGRGQAPTLPGSSRVEARHDAARRGRVGTKPTGRMESGQGWNQWKLRMPSSSCILNFSTARRWQLFRGKIKVSCC